MRPWLVLLLFSCVWSVTFATQWIANSPAVYQGEQYLSLLDGSGDLVPPTAAASSMLQAMRDQLRTWPMINGLAADQRYVYLWGSMDHFVRIIDHQTGELVLWPDVDTGRLLWGEEVQRVLPLGDGLHFVVIGKSLTGPAVSDSITVCHVQDSTCHPLGTGLVDLYGISDAYLMDVAAGEFAVSYTSVLQGSVVAIKDAAGMATIWENPAPTELLVLAYFDSTLFVFLPFPYQNTVNCGKQSLYGPAIFIDGCLKPMPTPIQGRVISRAVVSHNNITALAVALEAQSIAFIKRDHVHSPWEDMDSAGLLQCLPGMTFPVRWFSVGSKVFAGSHHGQTCVYDVAITNAIWVPAYMPPDIKTAVLGASSQAVVGNAVIYADPWVTTSGYQFTGSITIKRWVPELNTTSTVAVLDNDMLATPRAAALCANTWQHVLMGAFRSPLAVVSGVSIPYTPEAGQFALWNGEQWTLPPWKATVDNARCASFEENMLLVGHTQQNNSTEVLLWDGNYWDHILVDGFVWTTRPLCLSKYVMALVVDPANVYYRIRDGNALSGWKHMSLVGLEDSMGVVDIWCDGYTLWLTGRFNATQLPNYPAEEEGDVNLAAFDVRTLRWIPTPPINHSHDVNLVRTLQCPKASNVSLIATGSFLEVAGHSSPNMVGGDLAMNEWSRFFILPSENTAFNVWCDSSSGNVVVYTQDHPFRIEGSLHRVFYYRPGDEAPAVKSLRHVHALAEFPPAVPKDHSAVGYVVIGLCVVFVFAFALWLAITCSMRRVVHSRPIPFPSFSQARFVDLSAIKPLLKRSKIPLLDSSLLTLGSELGRGSFGAVLRGTYRGKPVAAKRSSMCIGEEEMLARFLQEAHLLCSLSHPNVLSFFGLCIKEDPVDQGDELWLVTELMDGDLESSQVLLSTVSAKAHVSACVVQGLAYLHSREPPVLHRDLKPQNVLLSRDSQAVKVADFGLSRPLSIQETMTAQTGTLSYMAPEVMLGGHYDTKSDMFSLGLLLTALWSDRDPYPEDYVKWMFEFIDKAESGELRPVLPSEQQCPPAVLELIQACVQFDPSQRPTSQQALALVEQWPTTFLW